MIEVVSPAKPGGMTHPRIMLPTVVLNVTDEMHVMRDEIFGPILPVVPYRGLENAIAYVNSRPRPLALYFFGPNGPGRRLVLERTTSGGVSINETNLHYAQEDIPWRHRTERCGRLPRPRRLQDSEPCKGHIRAGPIQFHRRHSPTVRQTVRTRDRFPDALSLETRAKCAARLCRVHYHGLRYAQPTLCAASRCMKSRRN